MKPFVPQRIVSGGQTGIDRAGLEVAIALGVQHGGWCPAGRLSEDGSIPSRYELQEMESSDYPARTEQNVVDSDATLILYEQRLKGGTLLTRKICKRLGKPYFVARMDRDEPMSAADWLREQQPKTLNVAGPRESNFVGIQERGVDFLMAVFADQSS